MVETMLWAKVDIQVREVVKRLAEAKGISISEYLRSLVLQDLGERTVFTCAHAGGKAMSEIDPLTGDLTLTRNNFAKRMKGKKRPQVEIHYNADEILLEQFEEAYPKLGFSTKSEALRWLMRFLIERSREVDRPGMRILEHQHHLPPNLTETRHK